MAIVKMKHLRLAALQSDREVLLRRLQRMGCVEIGTPSVDWDDPQWASLQRPDGDGLSAARERHAVAQRGLTTLSTYAPHKNGILTPRPLMTEEELFDPAAGDSALAAATVINSTQQTISALLAEQSKLQGQLAALAPWLELSIPLDTPSTRELSISFGSATLNATLEELAGTVQAVTELAELTPVGGDREQQYYVLFCHTSVLDEVVDSLKPYNWSRVNLSGWQGTAAENTAAIHRRLEKIAAEITTAEAKITAMGVHYRQIEAFLDRTAQEIQREESRSRLVDTQRTFYLDGWIPAECCTEIQSLLQEFTCAWETADPTEEEYPDVPVQLKNNWFTAPLNMVTEMYALPAYNGLDPNPLMAPFFILFYGVMMADMGYGLIMMLAGGLVLAKTNPAKGKRNFAGLALLCGVSTFIMGMITGGFFGDFIPQLAALTAGAEIALPSLFSPLDDALMVLIGSLILGVIQILTAMIISIVKQVRRGQVIEAICNEGAWLAVFVVFGIGGAIGQLSIAAAVAGVILVITQSYGKKGVLGKAMAIFGSLYNNITGYFSDILSYSRLMALMLAGAVIAQVFNTLGALTGNLVLFIIVSVVGNALNFGLNLLGCYVHDLRLQCLEYFGRFYEDGGRPFEPLSLDTKYVDIT